MRFSSARACSMVLALIFPCFCSAQDNLLKPFTTDGCSIWVDGTPTQPYLWRHCCVAHDRTYWVGGSAEERQVSDRKLQACIAEVGGKGMADYMYFFVTSGGSPLWLTSYRWGYGWRYLEGGKPRGYKVLTPTEQRQLEALAAQAEQTIEEDAIKHPSLFMLLEKPGARVFR